MKSAFALLLTILLAGCANHFWVTVPGSENYDFYRNGELVCESTNSCRMGTSFGRKMLLEIRKDDVTYAHLLVSSRDRKRDDVDFSTERFIGNEVADHWIRQSHSQGEVMLSGIVVGAATIGYLIAKPISKLILDNITQLPSNLTIPVGVSDSSAVPFPWDQPSK